MDRSTGQLLILIVLMTILASTMYVLSRAFKNEQIIKKQTPVVVFEEKEEEEPSYDVPQWLPWSYGWLGGYTGPVKRDMPHYYPGGRPNPHREERGAPEGYTDGRIFHKL